jgi:hypothetical protein
LWVPEPGKAVQHSNGNAYEVADNGSTIRRVLDESEDVKREIERELKRLRAPSNKVLVARRGDDIFVRIGKAVDWTEAYDLKGKLIELPSNCGYKAVLKVCA